MLLEKYLRILITINVFSDIIFVGAVVLAFALFKQKENDSLKGIRKILNSQNTRFYTGVFIVAVVVVFLNAPIMLDTFFTKEPRDITGTVEIISYSFTGQNVELKTPAGPKKFHFIGGGPVLWKDDEVKFIYLPHTKVVVKMNMLKYAPVDTEFVKYISQFFPNELKSKYFVFHSVKGLKPVDHIARFMDAYVDIINKEFFETGFERPLDIYVLPDRKALMRFLFTEVSIPNPPYWGIYIPQINGLVTYRDSGFGTYAHIVMYPLIEKSLPNLPDWAFNGLPSFFEKSYGYWDGDKLVLQFGFQNPWRISALGRRLLYLNLEKIINSPEEYGTSEKRMASVFLYQNGKMRRFIELVKANDKKGFNTFFEAAFEKNLEEIKPMWEEYLKKVYAERENILKLPPSGVFETKGQFDKFMKSFSLEVGSAN